MTDDFKPSAVDLRRSFPPLVGVFGRVEAEIAAAAIVHAGRGDGDGAMIMKKKKKCDCEYWKHGTGIIETCLKEALRADPGDVPFPLVGEEAMLWHKATASAYQHALEMMGYSWLDVLDRLLGAPQRVVVAEPGIASPQRVRQNPHLVVVRDVDGAHLARRHGGASRQLAHQPGVLAAVHRVPHSVAHRHGQVTGRPVPPAGDQLRAQQHPSRLWLL